MSLLRQAHLLARRMPRCVSTAVASTSSAAKATEKEEGVLRRITPIGLSRFFTDSFEALLRNSTFMALGDFKGRRLIGKITHVRDDDL